MASCVRNIRTKNYQNLIIGFQVTVENVGDVFFETQFSDSRIQKTAARQSLTTHKARRRKYKSHIFLKTCNKGRNHGND